MKKILLFILACQFAACAKIATLSTPSKHPQFSLTTFAQKAKHKFWQALHRGDYDDIKEVDTALMAAYLQNPNDPQLAAYLGFTHIWKITERNRHKKIQPTITNHIVLARKYFSDAVNLAPQNPIYQGFLGDSLLVEGKIFHDKREEVRGYFRLQEAINLWPEFNYFTAGYPMSTLAPNSKEFKEALAWQWKTLDLCAKTNVSRQNPNFSPYMALETIIGRKSACWNSTKAPHNFEGFFMNMGDMLVKAGDWKTAIIIYKNARLSKTYQQWPYRLMLEKRIHHAQQNIRYFNTENTDRDKAVMFDSGYGCVACHQAH